MGCKQPFMLPKICKNSKQEEMEPVHLGRLIHKRMNKLENIDFNVPDDDALKLFDQACRNHDRFALSGGRHFKHVVLRERAKKGETHKDTCARLLREEFYRKFVGSVPQYDFVYQRTEGSSGLLVYLINVDETEIDETVLEEKGKSNYFCAKDIEEICNNELNETRLHEFVNVEEARVILSTFSERFPSDIFDTSRWGGLDLFEAVMKYSKERRNSRKFELLEQIGRGAYSVVWRGRRRSKTTPESEDVSSEQRIAVKEMFMRNVPSKRVERVLSEIAAMKILHGSSNIVEMYDAEEHRGSILLAMQLCDGGTLREFIHKEAPMTDKDRLLDVVRQITSGLCALRKNDLVHRDLKPSNILIDRGKLLLADFGMSRSMRDSDTDSHVCGTIRYMAPEMLTQDVYGPSVDLWSLGCIVQEMLTGKHPFLARDTENTCETISTAMAALLSSIIQCRGPGNVTEVKIPTSVPFHMMIGNDSPVRIVQGLLQEYPKLRWTYQKLFGIMKLNGEPETPGTPKTPRTRPGRPESPETPETPETSETAATAATAATSSLSEIHYQESKSATRDKKASSNMTIKMQRLRALKRQRTIRAPDLTVKGWFKMYQVNDIPLGRDHGLITLSDTDSCLEALRVLLEHRISSAPVLSTRKISRSITTMTDTSKTKTTTTTTTTSTVVGFVDVLDLVTMMVRSHANKKTTVLDGLVSEIREVINLSGSNKLITVRSICSVAECIPLLVGGVKRLAVITEGRLTSILTQSEMLRWVVQQVTTEKKADNEEKEDKEKRDEERIGSSGVLQKLNTPLYLILDLDLIDLQNSHRKREEELLVVRSNATVASAFVLLSEHRLSAAPVVNETGSIVGVFSASDVRKMPSEEDGGEQNTSSSIASTSTKTRLNNAVRVVRAFASLNKLDMQVMDYLDVKTSGDGVITVTTSDTLRHVCDLLSTHSIHRVYVVDGLRRPCGIVSIADVLHAIAAPNIPFDVFANETARQRLLTRLRLLDSPTTCLSTLVASRGADQVYVDDPLSPSCCVAVLGTTTRRGKRETTCRVVDLSRGTIDESSSGATSSSDSCSPVLEMKIQPVVAQSIGRLASWVIRRATAETGPETGPETGSDGISLMWCGLEQSLWATIQRTMNVHEFQRTTMERCQLYCQLYTSTSCAKSYDLETSSQAKGEDTYRYCPLRPEDITTVNNAWKFKSESSLLKIKQIIDSGMTMAAYDSQLPDTSPPVCWMVTYENGSIGMLHTVPEYRRRGLASSVVSRLMGMHRSAKTSPPPVVYIEIDNHPSRMLFEGTLKWSPVANVAWLRFLKKKEEDQGDDAAAASESSSAEPIRGRNKPSENFAENFAKWEGWYNESDMLPPWDTDGKPCFALVDLLKRMPTFKDIFPNVIDVGTGGGSNSNWLKRQGFERVVGMDVSRKALELASHRNVEQDVEYVLGDIFKLRTEHPDWGGQFDFLVDIQVFHAIYQLGTPHLVRSYADLLRKGGVALVVAGNDREGRGDGSGPTRLSKDDLVEYFTSDGYFRVAQIMESRFDATPAYGDRNESPLCWVCLFVRTGRM